MVGPPPQGEQQRGQQGGPRQQGRRLPPDGEAGQAGFPLGGAGRIGSARAEEGGVSGISDFPDMSLFFDGQRYIFISKKGRREGYVGADRRRRAGAAPQGREA